MHILSDKTSEAEKAQHEPHYAWSLIGWIHSLNVTLESNASGKLNKL